MRSVISVMAAMAAVSMCSHDERNEHGGVSENQSKATKLRRAMTSGSSKFRPGPPPKSRRRTPQRVGAKRK